VAEPHSAISLSVQRHHGAAIVTADGLLDTSTYRSLRDTVIKAALDEPSAVIVDVNRLSVPSATAWSVFTSARWHVSIWPNIPIILVSKNIEVRRAIAASGVTRYVPIHASRGAALDATAKLALNGRLRARSELPRSRISIRLGRAMIDEWLTAWSEVPMIPVAATVATVFIENVLEHTDSAPVLIVENCQRTLTVAVEDCSLHPANRHEDGGRGIDIVSGLSIVSALSRTWGSTPTSFGKTVWALVGSENRL
jgi:anti-anti-sigma factor